MAPHRILIVENESTIALDLRNRVTRRGHAVVGVAASGENALAQALRHRPDLVVMDIATKEAMDGIEAVAAIRSELGIPVIYLTAHSDPATLDRAKPAQPPNYLIKPFSERDLAVTLEVEPARAAAEQRTLAQAEVAEPAQRESEAICNTAPQDVTEKALRARTRELESLLTSAPLGVAFFDREHRYVRVNEVLATINGIPAADHIGRTVAGVVPAKAAAVDPIIDQVFETGQMVGDAEITGETPREPGVTRHWLMGFYPVRDDDSGVVVMVGTWVVEITERKRAEAAVRESEARLREQNKSLERRVAEELAERAKVEEMLRHGQKMAAVGRIASGVAHDFNNILQGIMSALELVLDEVEPDTRAHEFAQLALGSTQRGSYLTHHLLSCARKQVLQPQAVELIPFLEDIQKLLTRTLGPHIAVEAPAPAEAERPLIQVDPSQLQTALLNLAINAAHAMAEGGTLRLTARVACGGQRVVVAVSDTGTGMDEATLAQAFEPFFTTKGRDGTGLGLSMVRGFAEQFGGEVRITSTLGQGTTVELRLPAAAASSGERSVNTGQRNMPRVRGRVLLVDDDPDVLATMGAFLEYAGLRVARAGSGVQALTILASGERFDALVTDHAMPDLNGADLVAEGRYAQPGLPALIISGFAETGRKALPEGVQTLRKPFSREELIAALHRAMRGAPGDQARG